MDELRLGLHESIDFVVEYFIASTPTQDQYNNQLIETHEIHRNARAYLLVQTKEINQSSTPDGIPIKLLLVTFKFLPHQCIATETLR